jgi:hypothetical protein
VRETASGRSAVLQPSNPEPAPRHCRLEDASATTTDSPTKARTSMLTLTVTPRRSFGECCRT